MRSSTTLNVRGFLHRFVAIFIAYVLCVLLLTVSIAVAQDGIDAGNGAVIVYVMGRDGQPVDRTFNVMLSRIGFGYRSIYQKTGTNGVTQFNGLAYSRYRVTVSDPSYNDAGAELEVTGARSMVTVTIEVDAKGTDSSDAHAKGFALAPKAQKELTDGMAATKAGNYADASMHLQAAYKLAPGNPDVNDALGELYLTSKDFTNAEICLQRAISIDPDSIPALIDMGFLQVQKKNYAAAEVSLRRSNKLAPANWFSHWLLGVAYLHLNEPSQAHDEAVSAIKAGKEQAEDAQFLLGESLAMLGRPAEAVTALQQLLRDAPTNSNANSAKTLIARLQSSGTSGATTQPTPNAGAGSSGGSVTTGPPTSSE